MKKIVTLENEKKESNVIAHRLFKTIINVKGRNDSGISDKHNQVQNIFTVPWTARGRGSYHKYLTKYVKEIQLQNSFVMKVPIFKQYYEYYSIIHNYIIGKGGAETKKIRNDTQNKIELPAEGDKTYLLGQNHRRRFPDSEVLQLADKIR